MQKLLQTTAFYHFYECLSDYIERLTTKYDLFQSNISSLMIKTSETCGLLDAFYKQIPQELLPVFQSDENKSFLMSFRDLVVIKPFMLLTHASEYTPVIWSMDLINDIYPYHSDYVNDYFLRIYEAYSLGCAKVISLMDKLDQPIANGKLQITILRPFREIYRPRLSNMVEMTMDDQNGNCVARRYLISKVQQDKCYSSHNQFQTIFDKDIKTHFYAKVSDRKNNVNTFIAVPDGFNFASKIYTFCDFFVITMVPSNNPSLSRYPIEIYNKKYENIPCVRTNIYEFRDRFGAREYNIVRLLVTLIFQAHNKKLNTKTLTQLNSTVNQYQNIIRRWESMNCSYTKITQIGTLLMTFISECEYIGIDRITATLWKYIGILTYLPFSFYKKVFMDGKEYQKYEGKYYIQDFCETVGEIDPEDTNREDEN